MLCPPAVLYLIYGGIHVIIDLYKQLYHLSMVEAGITLFFTIALQFLCSMGLGVISWIIIAIPFIAMALITSLVIGLFSVEPQPIIKTYKKPTYNVPPFYGSLGISHRPKPTTFASQTKKSYNVVEANSCPTKFNPARDGIYVDHGGIPVHEIFYLNG